MWDALVAPLPTSDAAWLQLSMPLVASLAAPRALCPPPRAARRRRRAHSPRAARPALVVAAPLAAVALAFVALAAASALVTAAPVASLAACAALGSTALTPSVRTTTISGGACTSPLAVPRRVAVRVRMRSAAAAGGCELGDAVVPHGDDLL